MTKKEEKKGTKKQPAFMCEVCRCRVSEKDAKTTDYLHCGRKMAPMEIIYMSDPSPSGP